MKHGKGCRQRSGSDLAPAMDASLFSDGDEPANDRLQLRVVQVVQKDRGGGGVAEDVYMSLF